LISLIQDNSIAVPDRGLSYQDAQGEVVETEAITPTSIMEKLLIDMSKYKARMAIVNKEGIGGGVDSAVVIENLHVENFLIRKAIKSRRNLRANGEVVRTGVDTRDNSEENFLTTLNKHKVSTALQTPEARSEVVGNTEEAEGVGQTTDICEAQLHMEDLIKDMSQRMYAAT